jgi:hypothetical protein
MKEAQLEYVPEARLEGGRVTIDWTPSVVPDLTPKQMSVVLVLFAGPCAGQYEVETTWPPPARIRAVHGGEAPAVLDLPGEEPEEGETLVDYERASYGFVCRGLGASAGYFPAGWTGKQRMREARRALRKLESVAS